jgi:putative redox protein
MPEAVHAALATRVEGYRHEVVTGDHAFVIDEPEEKGGGNAGPSPQNLLNAALASCTAVTMEIYADRKGWDIDGLSVAVIAEGELSKGTRIWEVLIDLPADLDPDQRERLLKIAARCPVHKALAETHPVSIRAGSTAP